MTSTINNPIDNQQSNQSNKENHVEIHSSKSRKRSTEQDDRAGVEKNETFVLKHEDEQKQSNSQSNESLKDEETYLDDDEDLEDSVSSPEGSANKRSISGSGKRDSTTGSSCHQCKSAKDPSLLLFCSSSAEKGVRKRKCRKKYCEACLKRSYSPSVSGALLSKGENETYNWTCPSCMGFCVCAACSRSSTDSGRDSVVDGINALSQLPPRILAFLGVRSDHLAQVQMVLSNHSGPQASPFGQLDAQTQHALNQLLNSMQVHEQQTAAQSIMQSQIQSHGQQQVQLNNPVSAAYAPNMPYQPVEQAMIVEQANHVNNQPVAATVFADPSQPSFLPSQAFAHSINQMSGQVNDWISAGSANPAGPRVMRAEIDLTGTHLQQSMSQPHNVSPLQQAHQPNHQSMNISPLQHARNQSYPSASVSANNSNAPHVMHSQPISPAEITQNYSLISSNPTSDTHALRRHSNQSMAMMQPSDQFAGQWASMDMEYDARRRASIHQTASHPVYQAAVVDESHMMNAPQMHESYAPQSGFVVETRKRAHSACMADVVDDHSTPQPVSARQRVSPPSGIPRSINGPPRKRSADQLAYDRSVHSRHPSQDLEAEIARQMQANMPHYGFSPSLNPATMSNPQPPSDFLLQSAGQQVPYDMNYSDIHRRRFSRAPVYDVEQQFTEQPASMHSAVQSHALSDTHSQNQSIAQHYSEQFNQPMNQYDSLPQQAHETVVAAGHLIQKLSALHYGHTHVHQPFNQQIFNQF